MEDKLQNSPNTPAAGRWSLVVRSIPELDGIENITEIGFLPTGDIDRTQTSNATENIMNTLLEPLISTATSLAQQRGVVDFDFWRFVNFIFVSQYWITLLSLGQIQTTIYNSSQNGLLLNNDMSTAHALDSTYNIFINSTLYGIYSSYLSTTVLPLLGFPSLSFARLSDTNTLEPLMPRPTTFLRSYTCQVRQRKDNFTAIFAMLTTIYVFTAGPFHFFIFVASFCRTRNNPEGHSPLMLVGRWS